MSLQVSQAACSCRNRSCLLHQQEIITKHIEDITQAGVAAIVKRNFDTNRYPWTCISDDFLCTNATVMGATTFDKTGTIEMLRRTTQASPDFRITIFSLSTHLYPEAGYAEVYVNAEASGGPDSPGSLARRYVSVFEYRQRNGMWLLVKETIINGMAEDLYTTT